MDGIASLAGNGVYSATEFALEGLTEALWQELEPIGLRAFLVEPGSFRAGLTPEVFPGDPVRAARVIYDTVADDEGRHRLILGSDAERRIQAELAAFDDDFTADRDISATTDFPGAGAPVL